MAQSRPKSPTRFARNAFLPAAAFAAPSYQKPMSRYEQRPTPSHPTKRIGRLSPRMRTSIAKMKRFRYAKNRAYPLSPAMYVVAYRWMRKPTPVTTSIMMPFKASMLNFTSIGIVCPSRPPVVCIHSHAFQTRRTCASFSSLAAWASERNAMTDATKLTPTAVRVISLTAGSPSRLPQMLLRTMVEQRHPESDRDERVVVRREEREHVLDPVL